MTVTFICPSGVSACDGDGGGGGGGVGGDSGDGGIYEDADLCGSG